MRVSSFGYPTENQRSTQQKKGIPDAAEATCSVSPLKVVVTVNTGVKCPENMRWGIRHVCISGHS